MKKIVCFILLGIVCLNLFACTQVEIPNAQQDVKIMFLNVGCADAAIVSLDGKNYMIDTGEDETETRLVEAANYMGITGFDGLILTHTHSDHIGGAKYLCKNIPVSKLYSAQISENKKNGKNKIEQIAEKCFLEHEKLVVGDKIKITDEIHFEVLAPIVYNADDDNDNSLVLRLRVNGRTVIFTGDMQFAEEQTLLNRTSNLKADVLKVGNHGNKDATSKQFALAVSPEYAIIPTDTEIDADSASRRVKNALSMAEIMVTGDFGMGILMTIKKDGTIEFDYLK